ncbi:unnamed protein product [Mytilus coruscus]|uniref:Uncharacterized protein n=1 Tax=Mytilus coruscus TaxID=42192 RepID=A0A6J8DY79_MYTCO|nr:unnamed protein product [Mytilus coruscus]
MATRDTEVKQYSHDSYGSTNCIEESISDIIPDTCIPIRDRTREEITDLPVCFLNNNTNTVPFNVLYGADTVENKLGTRRFVVGGALTVSMVIDNDRIKSNGTSTALEKNVNEVEGQNTQIKGQACHLDKFQIFDNCTSGPTTLQNNKSQLNDKRKEEKCTKGSTKCIFTQGSSTKEQEKKPTPRENPKALYEDQRKGRNGCFIKEHSGFKKDSEISSPSDEILKKRRNKRQVKDQAAVPPGSHGSLIKEDSGFQKNSEIFSPSGEIPKKKRAQRIEKKQDAVPTSLSFIIIYFGQIKITDLFKDVKSQISTGNLNLFCCYRQP